MREIFSKAANPFYVSFLNGIPAFTAFLFFILWHYFRKCLQSISVLYHLSETIANQHFLSILCQKRSLKKSKMYIKRLFLVMYEMRKPMYNNVVSLTKSDYNLRRSNQASAATAKPANPIECQEGET